LTYVGHVGDLGSRSRGPFVVPATRESGEAFLAEHLGGPAGAEGMALVLEGFADVVDGEVLLAEGDDLPANGRFCGDLSSPLFGRGEELTLGVFAELMDHDAKAPGRISEAFGGFRAGHTLDEIGPEGFVLSVCRILWL
jgi:hypothetical protein